MEDVESTPAHTSNVNLTSAREATNSYNNLDEVFPAEPIPGSGARRSGQHVQERRPSKHVSGRYSDLDELANPAPDQNPDDSPVYRHLSLEDERAKEELVEDESSSDTRNGGQPVPERPESPDGRKCESTTSKVYRKLTVTSYLVLFSILGTLARLGLQALTQYPGAPIPNTEVWANVGGSFIMGFMREDRLLFRRRWNATVDQIQARIKSTEKDEEVGGKDTGAKEEAATAFAAAKVTIPAYVGVTVDFCGSFTSFSSFMRDCFLALSNDLDTATVSTAVTTSAVRTRSDGYSVMAVLGVLIMEVTMSVGALIAGAHTATFLHPLVKSPTTVNLERYFDSFAIVTGWLAWLGAVLMAILPPDRFSNHPETWRGQVLFALAFAPLGCLLRFQLSLLLNRRIASFPLGTFTANTLGTLILGMCYDLQHASLGASSKIAGGGIVGCQVLQGIQDGFCGCLTTVSTWVLELKGLRRSHSYIYGSVSVGISFMSLVIIMGSLRWTKGFDTPACKV